MKLSSSITALALTTALVATGADAKDFFVMAVTQGPVTGSALGTVNLQATTPEKEEEPVPYFLDSASSASGSSKSVGTSSTSKESNTLNQRIGKWVSVNKSKSKGKPVRLTEGTVISTPADGETSTDTSGESIIGESTGSESGETPVTETPVTETPVTETPETETPETESPETETPETEEPVTEVPVTEEPSETPVETPTTPTDPTTPTTPTNPTTPTSPTPVTPPAGSGSAWANFDALMASGQVQGGDRIFLMDGYHGQLTISNKQFASTVVIAPAAGATAHAESILVANSKNVHVQGLSVWSISSYAGNGALVRTYTDVQNVAFTDLDLRSVASAPNYANWSLSQWTANERVGFLLQGTNVTAARNRITGIYHGINAYGTNALLEDNVIDGFSGDGIRALGDNSMVRRNKMQNCYQIDGNHADGFQSFSLGPTGTPGAGTVRNLTIEDNKIFEWTLASPSALRCSLQGIGMFDGMYDGVKIRNNVIQASGYHGITITGALNSEVVNNTVLNTKASGDAWPWIMISPHKNGTASRNTTVANNLTMGLNAPVDASKGLATSNNVVPTDASTEVVSFLGRDFRLKASAKSVDAGTASVAPSDDIAGTARPKGKSPDAGAYESY